LWRSRVGDVEGQKLASSYPCYGVFGGLGSAKQEQAEN